MLVDLIKWFIKTFKKIIQFFIKRFNLRATIIFGVGLLFIISGIIIWNVYYANLLTFRDYESKFLNAVKDFYYYHSEYLPKNGSVKTKKLSTVYEEGRFEELKIKGTKDICDLDSWVKVYNDNGNYIYTTYLKCGKYESKVDHDGPVIKLKGDNPLYLSLNHKYEEPGIESVYDKNDGKMDINSVTIDMSKINVKKVGKYVVTYSASDKLNNVTKEERIVYVVRNLTTLTNDATAEDGYYKGDSTNNYVLFSGMLFRIINVNSDGTVRLISNEYVSNLRADFDNYEDSNVDNYLNNYFYDAITSKDYLVDTEFCVGNVESLDDVTSNCSKKIKRKVALPDLYMVTNTTNGKNGVLCSSYNSLFSLKMGSDAVVASSYDGCVSSNSSNDLFPIKPVITLKSNVIIKSGDGSLNNPYKLDDYEYGKANEKINTRIIGEYLNYSGQNFIIIGKDDNDNLKLISVDGISKYTTGASRPTLLTLELEKDKKFTFNTKDKTNPGYILNNEFVDYISTTSIISSEYEIPTNVLNQKYNEYKTEKVKTSLFIPRTFDLFSAKQSKSLGYMYLYSDISSEDNKLFFFNIQNGDVLEDFDDNSYKYCVKIVITLDGNLLIKSGKGTALSPYYVR